jgi:hypothetical protein
MNERIKQLAQQAGWGKGETYDDCMQCSPFDPEIFAELIVWECMKICEDVMKKDNSALACWSGIKGTFRS